MTISGLKIVCTKTIKICYFRATWCAAIHLIKEKKSSKILLSEGNNHQSLYDTEYPLSVPTRFKILKS